MKRRKQFQVCVGSNIKSFYCYKKNTLFLTHFEKKVSYNSSFKLLLTRSSNGSHCIAVTNVYTGKNSNIIRKKSHALRGHVVAMIEDLQRKIQFTFTERMLFVGVGYRSIKLDDDYLKMLIKLGYSHHIYFGVPSPLHSFCIKFTKLFLFGEVKFSQIKYVSTLLRKFRRPDPYKGKGIRYRYEIVPLKVGKRV